jgi:nascent polypeptide-associated complex subunit alpha
MFPGVNPKQMQAVMKQMGISQVDIDASKVIIEKTDGKRLIIEPAQVVKIKMQGQESFQITGESIEESGELFSDEDVKTVMEKTGCKKDIAKKTLEKNKGDLAESILELSQ